MHFYFFKKNTKTTTTTISQSFLSLSASRHHQKRCQQRRVGPTKNPIKAADKEKGHMLCSALQISLSLSLALSLLLLIIITTINHHRYHFLTLIIIPPILLHSWNFLDFLTMEIVQEIFVTVSVAILLSFLVAKLLSMAVGGGDVGGSVGRGVELKSGQTESFESEVAPAPAAAMEEEMKFGDRLCVGGFESETRVDESVEQETTKEVDEFEIEGEKSAEVVDQSAEISRVVGEVIVEDCSGLQENLVKGGERGEGEESEVVESAVNSSAENSGEEVVVLTKRVGGLIVEECSELQENLVKEGKKEEESEDVESPKNFSAENSGEEEVKNDEIVLESKIDDSVDDQSEEIKVGGLIDSDEDDWEGIERSELEEKFAAAAAFVDGGGGKDGWLASVGSDVQMELYGLHKIATEGRCYEPQPMALKMSARAKWNAWQRQGNMTPEVAMEQYIALLSDRVPGWMEDNAKGESEKDILTAGKPIALDPDITTLLHHQANYGNKREPDLKSGSEGVDTTGSSNTANRDNE